MPGHYRDSHRRPKTRLVDALGRQLHDDLSAASDAEVDDWLLSCMRPLVGSEEQQKAASDAIADVQSW